MATTKGPAPWPMIKLGDLLEKVRSSRAGDGTYPILSMTRHDGLVLQEQRFKKRIAGSDLSGYKVIRRGELVVGFPIDEGVLDFQQIVDEGIVSPAYGVWGVKDGTRVSLDYLGRFLKSPQAIQFYKVRLQGTTARRRSLTDDAFLDLPVPLPPLDEQRRIADILDRSEKNVSRSQTLRRLYSDLASEVVRGFEDRAKHLVSLHELGEFRGGMTPSKAVKKYWNGGINWFTTKDLSGKMNLSESLVRISSSAIEETSLKQLSSRAIAFSLRGMSLVHRVPMGIIPEGSAINQDLKAFIPHRNELMEVLYWQIKLKEPLLLSKVSSSAHGTRKLDFEHLQSFKIPAIQDHDLEDLLTRLRNIADLVSLDLRRLEVAQELHKSLSTRAFQGEL
ncbi:restriction endonuclease subunit S [Corynebacterium cystitidis]|uniref:restriction endonuclease subunit S n=1 Tax=Corynebacterium cystitidis TaxID=35757 RepID=UPI00211E6959|nr:restriction endonuclease subunit S [Corynebacterium cystitidis]